MTGALPTEGPRPRLALQAALVLAIFALFIASLELATPYYFLQDDNRDHLLPFFVVAYRSLLEGEIAQINFHQALGMPLLANGLSSVLMPAPYLAILVSRLFWGHDFAAIEILVALYLATGGLGWLFLGRQLGLGRLATTFAALSWMLLPFNVYVSVSWVTFSPLVAFLPWMVGLSIAVLRSPRPAAWLGLVGVHLLLLFTGLVQWFVYACLFETAFVAIVGLGMARRHGARAVSRGAMALTAALIAAVGLGLPLLLPMWNMTQLSVLRTGPLQYGLYASNNVRAPILLNGLLVPWARLAEPRGDHHFTEAAGPPALFHLGHPALLLAALAIARRRRFAGDQRAAAVAAAILLVISVLWAMGPLAPIIYQIPLLNRFRWLFKLYPFAAFFALMLAALGLDSLARGARQRLGRAALLALAALQVGGLWVANLGHDKRGFYQHLDSIPLQEPMLDRFRKGRLFTIGWVAGVEPPSHTASSLGFNYASLWGLQHIGGYDPLISRDTFLATLGLNYEASFNHAPGDMSVDYLRAWGVRHYLVHPRVVEAFDPALRARGLRVISDTPDRRVFEDPRAMPLAFWLDSRPGEPPALLYSGNRARLAVDARAPGTLIVSLLFNPFYELTLDGRPHPFQRTELGQIAVDLPAGRHELVLRYSDPFFRTGVVLAGVAVAALAILYTLFRRRLRAL